MAGNNLFGDLSPYNAGMVVKRTLARGVPLMVLEPFISGKKLPEHQTKQMTFKRVTGDINFALDNAYLTEGVTPTGQTFSVTDYTLTLRQMGSVGPLTDVIQDNHPIDMIMEFFNIFAEQAPRILERDRFNTLKTATLKYYSGSATTRAAVVAVLTASIFDKTARVLINGDAMLVTRMFKTDASFNTVSVMPSWICAAHTDLKYDFEHMAGFKSIADYTVAAMPLMVGEIGQVGNFRIVLSRDLVPYANAGGAVAGTQSTGGVNCDVYPLILFGQEAWDTVAFRGNYALTPTALNPNTPRGGDDLGQRGSVGWKSMQGTLITNPAWIACVETAATAL